MNTLLLFVGMIGMTAATIENQGQPVPPVCNCPLEPACGENEAIFQCPPCVKTCEQLGQPIACSYACAAKGSCFCKSGYLRNEAGKCIPQEHCPKKPVCGENEEIVQCLPCVQSCEQLGQPFACALVCFGEGTCFCKSGYLKNKDGKCILKENCPKKPIGCGPHGKNVDCVPPQVLPENQSN